MPKKPYPASKMFIHGKPARCLNCLYVIDDLAGPDSSVGFCPECGTEFDIANPATFTHAGPYVAWKYWLAPAVGLVAVSLASILLFTAIGSYGIGLLMVLPAVIGFSIGYGTRLGVIGMALTAVAVLVLIGFGIFTGGVAGMFCSLWLIGIFIIPIGVFALIGLGTRVILKRTDYSQRAYLRYLSCIPLFGVAIVFGYFEKGVPNQSPLSVSTSVIIPAGPDAVWDSLVFYENATGERSLLLKLGLPTPIRAEGVLAQPGDVAVCIYDKGRARKVATRVVEGRELTFDVTSHDIGFERSVRLLEGSYELEPIGNGSTRLTMTTAYQPKLQGRWAWQPIERMAIRELHTFVGESIERSATSGAITDLAAAGE